MTTGKTIALTRQTFVGKVMSLLFNMLPRLVIAFLPSSKCLLISWLKSPSAVILEPQKRKSVPVFIQYKQAPGQQGKLDHSQEEANKAESLDGVSEQCDDIAR